MPIQSTYCENIDGGLVPQWIVLTFDYGEINWESPFFYYGFTPPMEYLSVYDFTDSIPGITIAPTELVINSNINEVGINLSKVRHKIINYGADPDCVRQFIFYAQDIGEVLYLLQSEKQHSLLLSS